MSVDCAWVEKNLEALFCDRLSEAERSLARAHMESCVSCWKEAQALNAVDPLIKNHFRRELAIARRPRVVHSGRLLGLGGTVAAVVMVLLLLFFRTSQTSPLVAPVAAPPNAASVASAETPPPIKADEAGQVARTKPATEAAAPADRKPEIPPAITSNAPDFHVTDPAGYAHTLDEYRGHVVVIAVWRQDEPESIANIERLYKAYAANPKFRFLGVSNERHHPKPANTTFPVLYNQGSKLFGAQPGEFVLLDEKGAVELRGSLVKDFESLTKALRGK